MASDRSHMPVMRWVPPLGLMFGPSCITQRR